MVSTECRSATQAGNNCDKERCGLGRGRRRRRVWFGTHFVHVQWAEGRNGMVKSWFTYSFVAPTLNQPSINQSIVCYIKEGRSFYTHFTFECCEQTTYDVSRIAFEEFWDQSSTGVVVTKSKTHFLLVVVLPAASPTKTGCWVIELLLLSSCN